MLTDLKKNCETSFVHISLYSVVMVPQAAIIRVWFVARDEGEWVGSGNKKSNVIVDSANEMKGGSGLARKVTKEAACSNSDEREIGVKKDVTVGKKKNFNTLNQRFSNRWWNKRQSSKRTQWKQRTRQDQFLYDGNTMLNVAI